MRIFFEQEEMDRYENIMTKVACLIYLESKRALLEMHKRELTCDDTQAIGQATGQVIFDDIIELTADMSREELVKYFAQSAIAFQVGHMNVDDGYRRAIMKITDELIKKEKD